MNGTRSGWVCICAAALLLSLSVPVGVASAQAQPSASATQPQTPPAGGELTDLLQQAQRQFDQLPQSDLPEQTRTSASELYRQAIDQLQRAIQAREEIQRIEQQIQAAPRELQAVQAQLAQPPEPMDPNLPADASLTLLEQQLSTTEAQLADARSRLEQVEAEPRTRATRRQEIGQQKVTLAQQIADVAQQLEQVNQTNEPPAVQSAMQMQLRARRRLLQRQSELNDRRLSLYDAEVDLLPARRDLAERQVQQLQQYRDSLQQTVGTRRQQQAQQQAQQAAQAARDPYLSDAVRRLAQGNQKMAEARTGPDSPATRVARAAELRRQIEQSTANLRKEFSWITEQATVSGLTSDVGAALRERRAKLPDLTRIRREIRTRQETIGQVHSWLIELRRQSDALPQLETQIRADLESLSKELPPETMQEVRDKANELLNDRRTILRSLVSDTTTLLNELVDLNTAQRQMFELASEYTEYVNQRVLWIRSTAPLGPTTVSRTIDAVAWLTDPSHAASAAMGVWDEIRRDPFQAGLSVLAVLLLGLIARPARRRLDAIGEHIENHSVDRFIDTLWASVLTGVAALPLPAALAMTGWWLERPLDASGYDKALAGGFHAAAVTLLTVRLLRVLLRPKGLADVHFRWPVTSCKYLRQNLTLAVAVILPSAAIAAVMQSQDRVEWQDALGRLALIISLLASSLLLYRTLRPWGPLLQTVLSRNPGSLLYRLRMLWFVLVVAAPAALAIGSAVGYHYTAVRLSLLLAQTLWLCLGLLVFSAILHRGLLLMLRRAAIRRARQRAENLQKQHAKQDESLEAPPPSTTEAQEVDLGQINAKIRRMLRFATLAGLIIGVYLIWIEALPALGFLDQVPLWNTTARVTETTVDAAGEETAQAVEKVVPISLADLLLAVVVLGLTVAAARNVPGLLEFSVLQRVHLDVGVLYAVKTIVLYIIAVVGVVIAFGMVGVSWGSVQWLLAAMTVGLGFGLQEIFANFVSGLIILFERPIRIGDTVTVGETHGTVTRIRIRATTITDWDRKELIVPNKEFITARLVNWSLSDKTLRVVLPVGIAYGSDTKRAEEILYRVAGEHPLVLNDPKPIVLFMTFGDNSLGFELRLYIAGIEHLLRVRHEMNMRIDEEFRKADITIAFPQRDVHLDSLSPVQVQLIDGRSAGSGPPPTP